MKLCPCRGFLVPINGQLQPCPEVSVRPEPELFFREAGVEAAPRLAVGLARVPDDLALEFTELRDQLGELANAYLESGADIDRLWFVITLCGKHDGFRGVLNIEKLS